MTLTLTYDLEIKQVRAVVKEYVHAKYHQAKCSGSGVIVHTSFFAHVAMVKNPKIRPCDLDL